MKTIATPNHPLGIKSVKLGRNRPVARGLRMKFRDYLKVTIPPAPPSCDYSQGGISALENVYMNDQLGDCVVAGGYHVVATTTGNAGDLFTATNDQIVADYGAIGGYVPGDESTDQGCDEQTALNYWRANGFADGTKLAGFLSVNASNQVEIQQAMFLFENLYFGVELPDAWISPFPSANGFLWDIAQPDQNNGHCFIGVGYTPVGVQIDTWGLFGTVTWAAVEALCSGPDGGELFVLLTPDMVSKATLKSPGGLDWDTLQTDFESLDPRGGLAKSS